MDGMDHISTAQAEGPLFRDGIALPSPIKGNGDSHHSEFHVASDRGGLNGLRPAAGGISSHGHGIVQGWSPERSERFGHAFLNAVLAVLPDLR